VDRLPATAQLVGRDERHVLTAAAANDGGLALVLAHRVQKGAALPSDTTGRE
jgi:hypothetical protein